MLFLFTRKANILKKCKNVYFVNCIPRHYTFQNCKYQLVELVSTVDENYDFQF